MIRDRAFAPQLLPILAVAGRVLRRGGGRTALAARVRQRADRLDRLRRGPRGVLLRGTAILPGVALGAFLCSLREGDGALFGAVAAAVTTAHVALSGWLLTRVFAFDVALARVRDVLALILVGATVSPLCNAAWSLVADAWRGTMPMPERLLRVQVTSLGEAVGILLLVPVLLTVIAGSASRGPGRTCAPRRWRSTRSTSSSRWWCSAACWRRR